MTLQYIITILILAFLVGLLVVLLEDWLNQFKKEAEEIKTIPPTIQNIIVSIKAHERRARAFILNNLIDTLEDGEKPLLKQALTISENFTELDIRPSNMELRETIQALNLFKQKKFTQDTNFAYHGGYMATQILIDVLQDILKLTEEK